MAEYDSLQASCLCSLLRQQLLLRVSQQQPDAQQAANGSQWEGSQQQRRWLQQHAATAVVAAAAGCAYNISNGAIAKKVERDQRRQFATQAAQAEHLRMRPSLLDVLAVRQAQQSSDTQSMQLGPSRQTRTCVCVAPNVHVSALAVWHEEVE
jgi:hypothetical protein